VPATSERGGSPAANSRSSDVAGTRDATWLIQRAVGGRIRPLAEVVMSRETSQLGNRDAAEAAPAVREKRRLLLLVRTGLTLAIGYLLIFSSTATPPPLLIVFVVCYVASNVVVALLPARVMARGGFDAGLILADTAAISFALVLIPDANTDVFVFYFAIILLASISDRLMLSVVAPIVTSIAYLAFLIARHGLDDIMQPAILLRLPFFLLTGTFYAFFVDRVRRRQVAVAAAQQRVTARTELLSMIAHDIKQPLWVATQSAALLYDQLGGDGASARELAGQVTVSLKRMSSLILNFLDLSRLESRALHASAQRVSLNRIVADLIDTSRPAFELRGLGVALDLAPALPPAWIDPLQTERCLANLLDNAVKFTPAGGTVTCRTAVDGDRLAVTIGDSGPGISAERYATLFDRFQDGTDAAGRGSTGLGLHIAHALATALGGEIVLDRDQPRGAWFRVRLPAASPAGAVEPAAGAVVRAGGGADLRRAAAGYPLLQHP
jgi:signal transduction histidine kinase